MNNEIRTFAHRSNGSEDKKEKNAKQLLSKAAAFIRRKAGVMLAALLVMVLVGSVVFGRSAGTEARAESGETEDTFGLAVITEALAEVFTGDEAEEEAGNNAGEAVSCGELVLLEESSEDFIYIPANMGAVPAGSVVAEGIDHEELTEYIRDLVEGMEGDEGTEAAVETEETATDVTTVEIAVDETIDQILFEGEEITLDRSELAEAMAEREAKEKEAKEQAAAEEERLRKLREEEAEQLAAAREEGDSAVPVLVMGKDWSRELTKDDIEVLCRIVEAEATGEDAIGKILVANVILNRVSDSRFKNTVYGVVFEKIGGSAQFSPTIDGRYWSVVIEDSTREAVQRAVAGEDYSNGALYFFQRSMTSRKNATWFEKNLKYLFKHGCHEFYTEKN